MSVPMWIGPMPAAAAAAAPALDPPGFHAGFHGLRVVAFRLETPDDSIPKSGMVVLAKMMAPASLRRAAAGASDSDTVGGVAAVPMRYVSPTVAMFSLTVTGTPSRGLSGRPFA
jgi:hypothetical protein